MKAKLLDINAMPFDRMELAPLPAGQLDVQIRLQCDGEAYARLLKFFTENDFEKPSKEKPLPSAPKKLKP